MMTAGDETQATPQHLDALTGIRGIAAWMVVLYHIRLSLAALLPGWTIAVFARGYLAVDLFFMLSGFVLWYNYADRLRERNLVAAGSFMWRRIARIWPLHLFILAVFSALVAVFAATGRNTGGYPLGELPLHVLLLQNWGWTGALAWNHPAWSISTELAAYLLFPLAVGAARWEHLPSMALAGLAAVLLFAVHMLFALNGDTGLGDEIPRLGLWRCLLEFALGNLLCIAWQKWRGSGYIAGAASLACGLALATGYILALPETAFVPLTFATGLLALASGKGRLTSLLGGTTLRYLGEISYSTYLAHFLLFILFKLLFVDASLQLGWAGFAGFLALVLAASAVLYHGVEKPAQRWLNRRPPRIPYRLRALPAE